MLKYASVASARMINVSKASRWKSLEGNKEESEARRLLLAMPMIDDKQDEHKVTSRGLSI